MSEEIKKSAFDSCPDGETLSAYFDGMVDPDSDAAKHIASCIKCSNMLAVYGAIGMKIKEETSVSFDSQMLERIKTTVSERIQEEEIRVIPFYVLLARAAVVFLAIAASMLYVKNLVDHKNSMQGGDSAPQSAGTVMPGSTAATSGTAADMPDSTPANDAGSPTKYPGGTLSLNDMKAASTDGGSINFSDKARSDDVRPAQIPKVVHHVWVVKDIDAAKAKLSDVVKQISSDEKLVTRKIKDEKTKCTVKNMDKVSLVKLVRQLASEGYQLLTPVQPQPEGSVFEGKPEEPVKYYFDLVKI